METAVRHVGRWFFHRRAWGGPRRMESSTAKTPGAPVQTGYQSMGLIRKRFDGPKIGHVVPKSAIAASINRFLKNYSLT